MGSVEQNRVVPLVKHHFCAVRSENETSVCGRKQQGAPCTVLSAAGTRAALNY